MQRRQTNLEKFSTFLESFSQGVYGLGWKWRTEPRLKRNLKKILNLETVNADLLAFSFLNTAKQNQDRKALQHLTAYLQEVAYWVSKQQFTRYGEITSGLTWEDYFQFANDKILEPQKLLCSYNQNKGTKITTYAQIKLAGQITNSAYSTMNWQLCSDWGLLRKISKKRLKKALEEIGGLSNEKLEQHLIIWDCFKIIYAPNNPNNTRKLANPTEEQYQQIMKQYNQMMVNKIKIEVVKRMLETCVKIARKYSQPQVVSYPENYDLPDDNHNYLENIEQEEQKEQIKEITEFLLQAINQLSLEEKMLLQLNYGLKINQTNIAKIFADNYPDFLSQQFNVSRKIDKIRKNILNGLFQTKFKQKKLKKEQITNLKNPCNGFIENYFQELLNQEVKNLTENKKGNLSEPEIREIIILFTNKLIETWELKNSDYLFFKQGITDFINTYFESV